MTPVRFLEGATAGHRCFRPGEVASISDMDARHLIRLKKAVPVEQAPTPTPILADDPADRAPIIFDDPPAQARPVTKHKPKSKFWKR